MCSLRIITLNPNTTHEVGAIISFTHENRSPEILHNFLNITSFTLAKSKPTILIMEP